MSLQFWIDTALEANRRDHTKGLSASPDCTGPFKSARALGITLMAMHDAYGLGHAPQIGPLSPFKATLLPKTVPASRPDAAAGAACQALRLLYPGQQQWLDDQLAASPIDPASGTVGVEVAQAYYDWRRPIDTPLFAYAGYQPLDFYDHDQDPETPGQGFFGDAWGNALPFIEDLSIQPLTSPPGTLPTGGAVAGPVEFLPGEYYRTELAEVRTDGAVRADANYNAKQAIGIYWGYDGSQELGTPPRLYMQLALKVLSTRPPMPEGEWLGLLATAAAGMADAGIQAWRYKYSPNHNLWRPALGVRHAAVLSNDFAHRHWRPLGKPNTNPLTPESPRAGQTPDFPSYPSGHATFGAVCMDVLRRGIRRVEGLHFADSADDGIAFSFVSDEFDGSNIDPISGLKRPRMEVHHPSLWSAIVQNSESRIWLGVHWRMDGLSRKGSNGVPVSGSPLTPGDLGPYGGVRLGLDIVKAMGKLGRI